MWAAVMLASLIDLPPVTQSTSVNCGPACVTAVLRYYGENAFEADVAAEAKTNEYGTHPKDMLRVVQEHKLRADSRTKTLRGLRHQVGKGRPVIVLIRSQGGASHYVVVVGVDDDDVTFFDPWTGRNSRRRQDDFLERWTNNARWSNCDFFQRWASNADEMPWTRWSLTIRKLTD